jgi:uncharacterized paraquat-inducible protein A
MDQQLKCPNCEKVFVIGEAVTSPSASCPQCGFRAPVPISTAKLSPVSNSLTARTFGCLLCLGGFSMLFCGFPLMWIGAQMGAAPHGANARKLLGPGTMAIAAVAFLCSGLFLLQRGIGHSGQYAGITQNAAIALAVTLITGFWAFIFALASCSG